VEKSNVILANPFIVMRRTNNHLSTNEIALETNSYSHNASAKEATACG
jgi:hypothetical protein